MRTMRGPASWATLRARSSERSAAMEWALGFVLFVIWLALFVVLGVATLRRGHWIMFIIGIFFPLLWIIGALIPPTAAARGTA
jgi:hypothetical protein